MPKLELRADCGACAGLCCIAYAFDRSEDFACHKRAGQACQHLGDDHRCAIHAERVQRGFAGCVAYDCHGAGQHATARFADADARTRNAAFLTLRHVHEQLWQLTHARQMCPPQAASLRARIARRMAELRARAQASAETLARARIASTPTATLLRQVGLAFERALDRSVG